MSFDKWDAMFAVGLVAVAVGFWFVYAPLAAIVPGACLMFLAMSGAMK